MLSFLNRLADRLSLGRGLGFWIALCILGALAEFGAFDVLLESLSAALCR